MTDETSQDEVVVEDELTALKERASLMGIKFHPNIGLDTLKEKIQDHVKPKTEEQVVQSYSQPQVIAAAPMSEVEKRISLKKEANRLVRIRIACMNPSKSEWPGEVFTTGNGVVGTLKKYVPFNVDWHVPAMMLTMIQDRKCQVFHTVTDHKGRKRREGRLVKEFSVEILPDLTPEQLKDLAQRQAMANGTAA